MHDAITIFVILSRGTRSFAALRMTHEGLRMTNERIRMAGCSFFVILSETKDPFQGEGEILRGVYPEPKDETLRFTQGDKAKGSE